VKTFSTFTTGERFFPLMLQFMFLVVSFVAETFTTVLAQVTKLTLMLFVMVA
jgi:hypothetical protein